MKQCYAFDEVFGHHIDIVVGSNKELFQYIKEHRKDVILDIDTQPCYSATVYNLENINETILHLVSFGKSNKDMCTISHEVIHIVYNVFEIARITFDKNNHEHFSYYHSYLMKKILDVLEGFEE